MLKTLANNLTRFPHAALLSATIVLSVCVMGAAAINTAAPAGPVAPTITTADDAAIAQTASAVIGAETHSPVTAAGRDLLLHDDHGDHAAQADATREQMTTDPASPASAAAAADDVTAAPALAPTVKTLQRQNVRVLEMEVTAYCACKKCCGPKAQGITASGKRVSYNNGLFVAADTRLLPFGTKLIIPGYAGGQPVEVIDRGGAIKGHKLDVYFDSHEVARHWGRQKLQVLVVE